ncbi:MAG: BON domain-containing protein [Planctomyces sp.]|nr:BON domain-containing protein [Planctomyces sp.]
MLVEPSDSSLSVVDTSVVARIERIVRCRTGGRIRDLRVDVQGDDVILTGSASTYYAKQLATHAVLDEVPGGQLTNSIEVL